MFQRGVFRMLLRLCKTCFEKNNPHFSSAIQCRKPAANAAVREITRNSEVVDVECRESIDMIKSTRMHMHKLKYDM